MSEEVQERVQSGTEVGFYGAGAAGALYVASSCEGPQGARSGRFD